MLSIQCCLIDTILTYTKDPVARIDIDWYNQLAEFTGVPLFADIIQNIQYKLHEPLIP